MAGIRMAPTVLRAQSIIGYKFKDSRLVWAALQAPGSVVRTGEVEVPGSTYHSVGYKRLPDGNRRLALLGDTVLELAIIHDWYEGDGNRERFYRVVSDVASNENLNKVGRTTGLDAVINKNPAEIDRAVSPIAMASTIEAIIGAVYLDGDMRDVRRVVQNLGLMPRLVRKIGRKSLVSKDAESPAASTSTVDLPQKPETALTDLEKRMEAIATSSQELEKSLRENSSESLPQQRLDGNAQPQ